MDDLLYLTWDVGLIGLALWFMARAPSPATEVIDVAAAAGIQVPPGVLRTYRADQVVSVICFWVGWLIFWPSLACATANLLDLFEVTG